MSPHFLTNSCRYFKQFLNLKQYGAILSKGMGVGRQIQMDPEGKPRRINKKNKKNKNGL